MVITTLCVISVLLVLYICSLNSELRLTKEMCASSREVAQDLYKEWDARDNLIKKRKAAAAVHVEKRVRNWRPSSSKCKSSGPHLHECDPFTGVDPYGESYSGDW